MLLHDLEGQELAKRAYDFVYVLSELYKVVVLLEIPTVKV